MFRLINNAKSAGTLVFWQFPHCSISAVHKVQKEGTLKQTFASVTSTLCSRVSGKQNKHKTAGISFCSNSLQISSIMLPGCKGGGGVNL